MEFNYNKDHIIAIKRKFLLNTRRKIAFMYNAKCGATSIRNLFELHKIHSEYESIPEDYTLFSVIRDPITRLVSGYIEVIQDCKEFPGGRFRYSNNKKFRGYNTYNFLDNLQKSKKTNTEKFLSFFEKVEKEFKFFNGHLTPYSFWLSDENKKLYKNIKLFKLEEMKELEDFFKVKIPRHNTCENNKLKAELLDYIKNNEDIKNRIVELYKDDYKLYNSI